MDIAKRVYDHTWKMDPIVRSLLDTDFYKLLMLQFIWEYYKNTDVSFRVKNRTKSVHLPSIITKEEITEQFDYVKKLRFTNGELVWLQGNTFYGKQGIFKPEFIEWLRTDFQLSDYEISDDQTITFTGKWVDTTMWEIYALPIINELRNRHILQGISKFGLDVLYSRAKSKIWDKFSLLSDLDGLNLTDFGTRRRHSFLWQEWVISAALEKLGDKFTGTSNAYLAMKLGIEAKGTNAHELPMVATALAYPNDHDVKYAQYKVLKQWQKLYSDNLLVALPDTYGTTQFLKDAPEWINQWTGFRVDSKDPTVAGLELIEFWKSRGIDPKEKLVLFSDGLDAQDIVRLHRSFKNDTKVGFGWGTNLTNDFKGCHPADDATQNTFMPISIVCKVFEVDGVSAVKLSDNYQKAMGSDEMVSYYRNIFGTEGLHNIPVKV